MGDTLTWWCLCPLAGLCCATHTCKNLERSKMVTFHCCLPASSWFFHVSWCSGMCGESNAAQCGGRKTSLMGSGWLAWSDWCSQGAWAEHDDPLCLLVSSWGISRATGSASVCPNPGRIFLPLISWIPTEVLTFIASRGSAVHLMKKHLFRSLLEFSAFWHHLLALSFCIWNWWAVIPYTLSSPCCSWLYASLLYRTFQTEALFCLNLSTQKPFHFSIYSCCCLYLLQFCFNFWHVRRALLVLFKDLYGNTRMFPVIFSSAVQQGGLWD